MTMALRVAVLAIELLYSLHMYIYFAASFGTKELSLEDPEVIARSQCIIEKLALQSVSRAHCPSL